MRGQRYETRNERLF
ncbi:hypothetical protein D022_1708A, partial [Vibrio parahaemolyticus 12310]